MRRRDEFSKAVIIKLRDQVANRCSNPDCRVPTCALSTNNRVNNIGKASHICAASPGGPRYDLTMTFTERKSINNAIWLCSIHAVEVDNDAHKYPVSLLKDWKRLAEETAQKELGKNSQAITTLLTL